MAQAVRQQQHRFRFTLNTDGQPHPLENTLVAVTLALGLV